MWIVVCIPLMALSVAIAVVPVLGHTIHDHRLERAHGEPAVADGVPAVSPGAAPTELSVECPVCLASMGASSDAGLIDAVQRHAWRQHGIPSELHILESARLA
jgi:hypothetical protein